MKPSLLLVGLGNPGAQYEQTRHNVGFRAIDVLSEEFGEGEWKEQPKYLSQVQEGRIVTAPVLLVKPQTFMNRSGEAINKLLSFFKLDPETQLIVFCDDVDIPLAELRIRKKGGPGTHNGLKSIVHYIGEEFPRARIGLGSAPTGEDLASWVLSKFAPEEGKTMDELLRTLPEKIRSFVLGES